MTQYNTDMHSAISDSDQFTKIIRGILRRGRVSEKSIIEFTGEAEMILFRYAFIHRSSEINDDNGNMYEMFKFVGDTLVDASVVAYIGTLYPNLVGEMWTTRIKHRLVSDRNLANFIENVGLVPFIIYGEEIKESMIKFPDNSKNKKWIKMLDHIFRAFLGALTFVIDSKKAKGTGFAVVYNVVTSFFQTVHIELSYENLFDAKTRIKSLYDGLKWNFPRSFKSTVVDLDVPEEDYLGPKREYTTVIVAYPLGNRAPYPNNAVEVARVTGYMRAETEQIAAERALGVLRDVYHITPRGKQITMVEDVVQYTSIHPAFKHFITVTLSKVLGPKNVALFTDDESMQIFRRAFIHPSVNSSYNYEQLEFSGDAVVNTCVAQYLRERFPRVINSKYLTRLKHNLISKSDLSALSEKNGFLSHIYYDSRQVQRNTEEFTSMMEDVLEAFFGALIIVINKKKRNGVGFGVCYYLIKKMYDEREISLNYWDIFDPRSIIKELFDMLKWHFEKNTPYRKEGNGYRATIYGFPNGDREAKPENKTQLASVVKGTKTEAEQSSAQNALYVLRKRYNIRPSYPSPYSR